MISMIENDDRSDDQISTSQVDKILRKCDILKV